MSKRERAKREPKMNEREREREREREFMFYKSFIFSLDSIRPPIP
jgi:hypothetical protein